MKRSLHESIGGFDEYILCSEDTDYCWKLQLQGTPLHFAKDAMIHSRHRPTANQAFHQGFSWAVWGAYMYKRYEPHGMKPLPWSQVTKRHLGLLKWSLYCLIFDRNNQSWQWLLGWRLGYLRGCIKHRVFAFVDG